jgi:hypothetical protein
MLDKMKKFYVYVHFDNLDRPFYIGKGSSNRVKHKGKLRSNYWHNYINKYGFKDYILIEEDLDEKTSFELEKYWISQFKCWGFRLINLTDGGDGCTYWTGKKRPDISLKFKGHKVSDHTRNLISKGNKGNHNSINTEFKKGIIYNKKKSKYKYKLYNHPAKWKSCICGIGFLYRIDKNTKYCSIKCAKNNK